MITFIVPIFVKMFSQLGGTLPLPTRMLVLMSNTLSRYFFIWLLLFAGAIFGFRKYGSTKKGRYVIDSIKLKLPIFGKISKKIAIAQFTRTFGTLVSSGVSILQTLEIVGEAAGNAVVTRAVEKARTSIKQGETIANPLSQNPIFPPMVVHMIAVGEETGSLDSMLNKIADFYDEEVGSMVESLTSIIEPVMIMVMGTMLGFIVVALYMPMFQVITLME
jgi:type IV pilus assembly protein PilC